MQTNDDDDNLPLSQNFCPAQNWGANLKSEGATRRNEHWGAAGVKEESEVYKYVAMVLFSNFWTRFL